MDRFWDKNNNYSSGTLKEYDFWVLEVSYRQHTFGNFIVFCKRYGVEKISELHDAHISLGAPTNGKGLEIKVIFPHKQFDEGTYCAIEPL